jgi:hypothetical protein
MGLPIRIRQLIIAQTSGKSNKRGLVTIEPAFVVTLPDAFSLWLKLVQYFL